MPCGKAKLTGDRKTLNPAGYDCAVCCVQIVISQAEEVNKVQYVLMAVEGCICSAIVIMFVFYITSKVQG